jgi:hypothetical protein
MSNIVIEKVQGSSERAVSRNDTAEGQSLGLLIRRMILSAPADPRSVSAMLHQGELHLAGATGAGKSAEDKKNDREHNRFR